MSWFSDACDWVEKNKTAIISTVAATAVSLAVAAVVTAAIVVTCSAAAPALLAGALVIGAVAGAAGAFTGYAVTEKLEGRPVEVWPAVKTALIGAVLGAATLGIGSKLTPLVTRAIAPVTRSLIANEVVKTAVAEAGTNAVVGGVLGGSSKVAENAIGNYQAGRPISDKLSDGVGQAFVQNAAMGVAMGPVGKAIGIPLGEKSVRVLSRLKARFAPAGSVPRPAGFLPGPSTESEPIPSSSVPAADAPDAPTPAPRGPPAELAEAPKGRGARGALLGEEAIEHEGGTPGAVQEGESRQDTDPVGGRKPGTGAANEPLGEEKASGVRVEEIVEKVYPSIDPDRPPARWEFDDTMWTDADGMQVINTEIRGPKNPNVRPGTTDGRIAPHFERAYDPKTGTLEMREAFLKDLATRVHGTPVELAPGKGIPTQAYVTMRQMRKLGIAQGGLKHVKMSRVQNVETMIQLEMAKRAGVGLNEAVLKTASVEYARTTLTQSGHKIVPGSASVIQPKIPSRAPIGEMMDYQVDLGFITREKCDALLAKYGIDRSLQVNDSFDIHLNLEPVVR